MSSVSFSLTYLLSKLPTQQHLSVIFIQFTTEVHVYHANLSAIYLSPVHICRYSNTYQHTYSPAQQDIYQHQKERTFWPSARKSTYEFLIPIVYHLPALLFLTTACNFGTSTYDNSRSFLFLIILITFHSTRFSSCDI